MINRLLPIHPLSELEVILFIDTPQQTVDDMDCIKSFLDNLPLRIEKDTVNAPEVSQRTLSVQSTSTDEESQFELDALKESASKWNQFII